MRLHNLPKGKQSHYTSFSAVPDIAISPILPELTTQNRHHHFSAQMRAKGDASSRDWDSGEGAGYAMVDRPGLDSPSILPIQLSSLFNLTSVFILSQKKAVIDLRISVLCCILNV